MDMSNTTNADMNNLRNDMNDLKRDMSSLMKHLGSDATDSAKDISNDIMDGTDKFMRNMYSQGNKSFKTVQNEMGKHPTLLPTLILATSLLTASLLMKKP
jgi:ElaB/YqjD/DUF883 family membrane-anchored ribosome-binding protein